MWLGQLLVACAETVACRDRAQVAAPLCELQGGAPVHSTTFQRFASCIVQGLADRWHWRTSAPSALLSWSDTGTRARSLSLPSRPLTEGEEGEKKREKGEREEEEGRGLTCGPRMSVGPHLFLCE
jgi:hypothetical protein